MTAHPRPPYDEDDDLDLRALYRTLPRTEPGPALDAAIHGAAARALAADRRVQRQHRLWHPGWGVAASIVLTACLFLLTDFQDPDVAGLADAPPVNAELARPPQTVPRPAPSEGSAALRRYAPAPQAERAAPMAPAPAQQFSVQPPAPSSADQAAAEPEAAAPDDATQARIDHILELLQAGQRDEALRALQDLKNDDPDVALPPELQDLPAPE